MLMACRTTVRGIAVVAHFGGVTRPRIARAQGGDDRRAVVPERVARYARYRWHDVARGIAFRTAPYDIERWISFGCSVPGYCCPGGEGHRRSR